MRCRVSPILQTKMDLTLSHINHPAQFDDGYGWTAKPRHIFYDRELDAGKDVQCAEFINSSGAAVFWIQYVYYQRCRTHRFCAICH